MNELHSIRPFFKSFNKFGLIILFLFLSGFVSGEMSGTISIDPIVHIHSNQPFPISGSIINGDCTQVGIEIFPKDYWDKAISIAEFRKSKGFRLSLLFISQSITDTDVVNNDDIYSGVFLHLFNPDGTIAFLPASFCPNHRIHFSKVIHHQEGKKSWSTLFNTERDRMKLKPDLYVLLVWDATNQSFYTDTHIENIYDVKNNTIYPTTKKGPIWEPDNKKELMSGIIEIR